MPNGRRACSPNEVIQGSKATVLLHTDLNITQYVIYTYSYYHDSFNIV